MQNNADCFGKKRSDKDNDFLGEIYMLLQVVQLWEGSVERCADRQNESALNLIPVTITKRESKSALGNFVPLVIVSDRYRFAKKILANVLSITYYLRRCQQRSETPYSMHPMCKIQRIHKARRYVNPSSTSRRHSHPLHSYIACCLPVPARRSGLLSRGYR